MYQSTVWITISVVCALETYVALALLSGNERYRIDILTQCAEWSQFAVDYFCSVIQP